tara:strand:+ start:78 stop:1703 length:1626 start_codon:yes stop_codon:yes gene_type:complete
MSKKNILLFFIDALRFDLVNDAATRKELMPTLDQLLENGFYNRVVANAGATQYVLPSILTQSYPLDYDGYNTGIEKRPKSIIEQFKEEGYVTYATVSSYLYMRVPGFFRGFDHIRGLYPVFRVINKVIVHQISHEINLWRKGVKDKREVLSIIQFWFGRVLGGLKEYCENHPETKYANRFRRRNVALAPRIAAELALLKEAPEKVLKKLTDIEPYFYWTTFGDRDVTWRSRLIKNCERVYSRLAKPLFWTGLLPRHLRYQDMPVDEMVLDLPRFLQDAKKANKPWFLYLHILNIHSFQVTPGFYHQLKKYRLIPRVYLARRRLGRTWQPFMHDLTLLDLDLRFGKLLSDLKAAGELSDDTVIAVFGDHGMSYGDTGSVADSHRGFRTHRVFLDTVLAVAGTDRKPSDDTIIDSLGLSATLMDLVEIPPHETYKGISALSGGREFIISETAGRGNCDIDKKDLYFTVTSKTHKLFTALRDDRLEVISLINTVKDPDELEDIKDNPDNVPIINKLMDAIYTERNEILTRRHVPNPREPMAAEA